MAVTASRIVPRLRQLFSRQRDLHLDPLAGPLRGELLGSEHLAERIRAVATAQRTRPPQKRRRGAALLVDRLDETERILEDAHRRLNDRGSDGAHLGPAGEWLLDNFHVVREHIREVRESLPQGFYRELPESASGRLAGYPRVYELAITLISHSEGRIDVEIVDHALDAFQGVSALSIGELWALPAMLRLGLIESVRRMTLRTVQRLDETDEADRWAQRIEAASEAGDAEFRAVLHEFILETPSLNAIFVSRFLQQIRLTRGSYPPLEALELWIAEEGMSPELAAAQSTQRLAHTQIVMAHSITSLRSLTAMDWKRMVERHSALEAVLRQDPSGYYERMTFGTRDRYRHVVERIARRVGLSEVDVAEVAMGFARGAADRTSADAIEAHIGYHLVDAGVDELERVTGYRVAGMEMVQRWMLRHPDVVLGGGLAAGTGAATAAALLLAGEGGTSAWLLALLVALLPATEVAISTLNQLLTAVLPPRILPKLDMLAEAGIPAECRTAVVVPILFDGVDAVLESIENLEIQFLANREKNLHFALLGDFTDASTETAEGDDQIIAAAVAGIRGLNERYAPETKDAFYLFHRPRQWNSRENVWMGWERKRGKLADFNRFVRQRGKDAFRWVEGEPEVLRQVRYVITLDADTVLPPESAALLVGTMAHPLNRAVYDEERGRIVRGYGILQPRVGISLPSAIRSVFASTYAGQPGVDPYTAAVSDVYQDLYGEGSFTGKGIYEVDAFEQATLGRFPQNTLLSHDLIEGSYARAGLATEIILYDDYPSRYLPFTRRKHRWIRGDWQLLGWLNSRVPGPDGPEPNRLPMLSRWKILDNLRRSLVENSQLVFLVAGWTILPGSPVAWTILGVGAIAAPWIVALFLDAVRPPLDKSWRAYYAALGGDAVTSLKQFLLAIVFLPHQAWISADAIIRTLWRLFVSRRHMLEWQTASQAERGAGHALHLWRTMLPAVLLSLGILALAVGLEIAAGGGGSGVGAGGSSIGATDLWTLLAAMTPFILLWVASPAIAHSLSRPLLRPSRPPTAEARETAHRYALLHWRYFDRFVTAETGWLVPDNVQEDPERRVAMRTSPTNIGLQLMSTVSAHDLGFVGLEEMVVRLERAFDSLDRMPRMRGHFFNWYELPGLGVMEPSYVSTVDSGNLAGHLIALRQACLMIARGESAPPASRAGLRAGVKLALQEMRAIAAAPAISPQASQSVVSAIEELTAAAVMLTPPDASTSDGTPFAAVHHHLNAGRPGRDGSGPRLAGAGSTDWLDWCLQRAGELSEQSLDGSPSPEMARRLDSVAERALHFALAVDFRFVYDEGHELFSIGYQPARHARDPSFYDLLASEARLASFIAVANGDVPVDHWFRLGRTLTHAAGETALVSWSGSMFEYLMPGLVMRSFPNTMLQQSNRGAVRRQITYAAARGVPWGISESAYNFRDRQMTYQYRAFGVPDLALKRGLGHDLVVAPYASLLATMMTPRRAFANLAELEELGSLGEFGFHDAIDYTRPEPGQRFAIVRNYMAHHIGMSLVALDNLLSDNVWQRRFHAEPLVRAVELLLHERVPRRLAFQGPQEARPDDALPDPDLETPTVREIDDPGLSEPHIALLGRQPYTVMISHAGSGYSRYEDLAVTRWRADATADASGQFVYLRDVGTGRVWSSAHQPTAAPADWYRALLGTDQVSFHRADGPIETLTEIAVVPEDAAEVRRVTITNNGSDVREIEITSYGEIVLGPPSADRAHPAFGNLFVETEWHEWCAAITASRRPRSTTEQTLWGVHLIDSGEDRVGTVSYETDRAEFLGRGGSVRSPAAMRQAGALSGTTGAVLDPIFAVRTTVRLQPGASASVAFTTLVATCRERAFELADRYHEPHASQRALDLAWTSKQVELRELGVSPADAAVFQEIAGYLLYPHPGLRASPELLLRNRGSQPLLWSEGISGDWPIILSNIASVDGLPTLRQVFAAHRYMRRRGMMVDLLVLIEEPSSYQQDLQQRVMETLFASSDVGTDMPGGVFVRRVDQLAADALLMLQATARVHLESDGRALALIVETARAGVSPLPPAADKRVSSLRGMDRNRDRWEGLGRRFRRGEEQEGPPVQSDSDVAAAESAVQPTASAAAAEPAPVRPTPPRPALHLDNSIGGFTEDGDYQMHLRGDLLPPAPWANVIANPRGGFTVTERGGGCVWAGNSYFFRLNPWSNDPVTDPPGEAIYLRDADTGEVWLPVPAFARDRDEYVVRHAPGSSTFEHERGGIESSLRMGMARDEPVKLSLLRLTNSGETPRRIEISTYVEWTLGITREHTRHQVHTSFDPARGALYATNHFDPEFTQWTAFSALSEPVTSHTGDRGEFLGRNGSLEMPAALGNATLSDRTGAGADPCAALRSMIELAPGESQVVVVLLGATDALSGAGELVDRFGNVPAAKAELDAGIRAWNDRLSVIKVRTPDPSFDVMINHWSLYQALACRMWARAAIYQSSGAYGFRDQLQDCMAFVYAEPTVAREHILRAAARQFLEGDVQHWWHPQSGRGVRTRFSDDLVWLPFVVEHYVRVTGDDAVLDEYVPFLEMRPLGPDEHEIYDLPGVSEEHGSVYEHCLRALRRACTSGVHGLPLIGIGDWNDGMSRVGVEGKGESVWLAWFLIATLRRFAPYAEARGDLDVARDFRDTADRYAEAVEASGWDGEWYRRAYFDNGTPLGSSVSEECQIDSIAQSWSIISGAGDPARQDRAMRSLREHLVRRDAGLIVLLTPPFDRTVQDPGYIKGYLPGVRENGAQYTHAALWAVLATALQGDGDGAFDLFQMINPLTHAATPEGVATYKVEPYVVAADVYTAEGQLGRGGWTWYTGSASWMYRVGLEAILGLQKRGNTLTIEPRVPAPWAEFSIDYRFGGSLYRIAVREPGRLTAGEVEILMDGERLGGGEIPLRDDGAEHEVIVRPAGSASEA